MTEKNNARPDAATSERAENGTVGRNSSNHYTTDFGCGQIRISDFLGRGQENAIPLRQLKLTTGFDGRTIRLMIQDERLSGIPILADCQNGYYLPLSEREKQLFVAQMYHRAAEIEKTATAVFAAEVGQVPTGRKASDPPTQETIQGWENG